jgi:magnesium transporter
MDIYINTLNTRMNEVMKVLTIISTIFIPLTFIVGVYGMNFNTEKSAWNMPELNSPYGYPIVMGIMVLIVIGMMRYFKYKKWF